MQITNKQSDESNRAYAIRMLRDNIVSTELKPGTLISENEISSALGLSRVPVREAIIELSQTGIIEVLPQRGSRISLIDMNLVEEAAFLRRTVEEAIIRQACEMVTPEILTELEANLKLQAFYMENKNPGKQLELDNDFHRLLYVCCNKERCYQLVNNMQIHFDRVRSLALSSVKDPKILSDHTAMYEAIRDNKPEEAVNVLKKHLSRYSLDKDEIMKAYPEYF